MQIFVQEIISEFLNPDNVIKESNGELLLLQIKQSNIQEFRNLKVLLVLNAHDDQGALDIFGTLLDFYKLVVDELFFHLGEIVLEQTWLARTPITYCVVSFEATKSIQTKKSRNGATESNNYKPTSLFY